MFLIITVCFGCSVSVVQVQFSPSGGFGGESVTYRAEQARGLTVSLPNEQAYRATGEIDPVPLGGGREGG